MALLFVAACTPSVRASGHSTSRALPIPVHKATVCEVAHWGHSMVRVQVRVRAEYFTDLRHGAFLSDRRCPGYHLQLAEDAPAADKSVSKFNEITAGNNRYIGHKFKVDVTGIFEWSEGRIINQDLPPDRQYHIPPHGMLSLLKVWNFDGSK